LTRREATATAIRNPSTNAPASSSASIMREA
jgi:hypothetical protein